MNYWYSLQERIFHQQTSPFTLALHGTLGSGGRRWRINTAITSLTRPGSQNSPHSAVTTVLFFSGMYCNKTLNKKKGVSSRLLEVHLYIYTFYLLHVPYLIFASASNFLSHTYLSSHHNDTSYLSLSPLSLSTHAKKVKSTGLNALRKVRCGTAFPVPFVSERP